MPRAFSTNVDRLLQHVHHASRITERIWDGSRKTTRTFIGLNALAEPVHEHVPGKELSLACHLVGRALVELQKAL